MQPVTKQQWGSNNVAAALVKCGVCAGQSSSCRFANLPPPSDFVPASGDQTAFSRLGDAIGDLYLRSLASSGIVIEKRM